MGDQKQSKEKPAFTFREALQQVGAANTAGELEMVMQVLAIDRHLYTVAEQQAIGTKMNDKYTQFRYGFRLS